MKKLYLAILFSSLLLATACRNTTSNQTEKPPSDSTASATPLAPDWAKNATIYEVNTRQFSPRVISKP
ncbi:hypothetical protein [Spirosoma telluris]|uniref:hypothetical protein n=1 Tax=Spirosoma telluris TaxID=2183553 RepID=UPI002FC3CB79